MAGPKQIRRAQRLRDRIDECETLLAALVLQYGTDGRLVVNGADVARVADLAKTRPLAVQLLASGDLRIDFEEPELTITTEEASCTST